LSVLLPAGRGQSAQATSATRLVLGSSSGEPGSTLVVPVYLSPAPNVEIGKVEIEVNYVAANMKFVKLDAGTSSDASNVELRSDVKDGKNDKDVATQTVSIVAAVKSPETTKSGIPSGLLAFLTLELSKTARPANITLRTTATVTDLKTGKPITNLQTEEAKIEVLAEGAEPAVACFFFTH
jgi:cohesin domain-containing protein